MKWVPIALTVLAFGTGFTPGAARAQVDESRVLREAAALESIGDLKGAEDALRLVLEPRPGPDHVPVPCQIHQAVVI